MSTPEALRMKLAVPKKGRIYERVMELLKDADIRFNRLHRQDVAICTTMPLTIFFLPASDIAKYVSEGNVDLGITGHDIVLESRADVDVLGGLDLGRCALSVQVPSGTIRDPAELGGKRIVTSFPYLTERFFASLGCVPPQIRVVSGSVEAAIRLGLGDAIVDLVETGETMRAAGLENIADIVVTETVLIKNHATPHASVCEEVFHRIEAVVQAKRSGMLSFNIPKDQILNAIQIVRGALAPTVSELFADPSWVAVSVMVPKSVVLRLCLIPLSSVDFLCPLMHRRKRIQEIMDALESLGARDQICLDIRVARRNRGVAGPRGNSPEAPQVAAEIADLYGPQDPSVPTVLTQFNKPEFLAAGDTNRESVPAESS